MTMKEETKNGKDSRPRPAPPPPRIIRERVFHSLPAYSGPYSVGTMEIELPVREPRTFSGIKREKVHALRMDTVLFSVFYPCDTSKFAKTGNKPSRATWLPRPRTQTSRGYAKFLSIPHLPVTGYIAATTMFTKIPAFRNAKLAGCRPGQHLSNNEENLDKGTSGGDVDDKPQFAVIMFSHGLGGSRMCYSSVCGELASNGFIVVALEHRDGSGARSYVNIPPSGDLAEGKVLDNTKAKKSYVVDYIFPKDNAQDTSPNNQRGVDHDLRDAQIEMRMAEIMEAYYAMELINSGQGELVLKNNLRKEGNCGSSSKGLDNIDWPDWVGRLRLDKVTAMGHSFGGATTVQITREDERFPWVGQGILLDAWGPAIPKTQDNKGRIGKPLLAIGSEAFMHWPENFDAVFDICQQTRDTGVPCWMLTVKGSTHLSQTDFAVLYYRWMSYLAKNVIHSRRAVLITVNSSLEFLKNVLPKDHTFGNSWVDEGILHTESLTTDELPKDHKPSEKWTAARLRIPNEFRLRIKSWSRRTPKEHVPKDASGKPLAGVITHRLGDEVWMHMSPGKDDMDRPDLLSDPPSRLRSRHPSRRAVV